LNWTGLIEELALDESDDDTELDGLEDGELEGDEEILEEIELTTTA